ncbi:MAG: undecaprenyl-diphosphate phosphatase [Sporomusaceae bacterium]|nr:undecaprenyl-diphosphate phosphatase [Sporomusaceae bacterium]
MHEYIIAVIIGVIEGVTEFLPISSTGHMILAGAMLGFEGEVASAFQVFIQLGAILAVLLLYREKFRQILSRDAFSQEKLGLLHLAAAIVPAAAAGFILHSPIKQYLFSPLTVIVGLIAGAVLMIAAERSAPRPQTTQLDAISVKQAFYVGLFQLLSLWPGFSRSGSTIAGGMFLGVQRTAAAEFSFIVAVPLMFAACLYDLLKIWDKLSVADLQLFAIGFVVAFGVAYLSIVWFLRFLNSSTLTAFACYRIVIAAFAYAYFFL